MSDFVRNSRVTANVYKVKWRASSSMLSGEFAQPSHNIISRCIDRRDNSNSNYLELRSMDLAKISIR